MDENRPEPLTFPSWEGGARERVVHGGPGTGPGTELGPPDVSGLRGQRRARATPGQSAEPGHASRAAGVGCDVPGPRRVPAGRGRRAGEGAPWWGEGS